MAAALALAERERRSGMDLVRAVALGYDVSSRLTMTLDAAEFRRVGHLTHAFGPTFGSAAACAALARLNARQARHVLSYAAQQASGLSTYMRDTEHVEKAFDFGGMPARNGITAATMVASGCTGVDDVFSGERNFFVAFDESRRTRRGPHLDILVRDLGKTYEIVNTNISAGQWARRFRRRWTRCSDSSACTASRRTTWRGSWFASLTGEGMVVIQAAPKAHPDLPNVPLAINFGKNQDGKQLIDVVIHGGNIVERTFLLPPGVPKGRAEILKTAFTKTLADAEFLAEAGKARHGVAPIPGEELERRVNGFFKLPEDLKKKIKRILFLI